MSLCCWRATITYATTAGQPKPGSEDRSQRSKGTVQSRELSACKLLLLPLCHWVTVTGRAPHIPVPNRHVAGSCHKAGWHES